jgi:hypothetical protein
MLDMWDDYRLQLPPGRPVVIACPGAAATPEACARVPEDAYVIACNYGACLPLRRIDEWIVTDSAAHRASWWSVAKTSAAGALHIFSQSLADNLADAGAIADLLVTPQGSALGYDDPWPQYGCLRCNVTIAGDALQRAWWGGAVDIYALGIDMRGSAYFDGNAPYERPGDWPYLRTLQTLCGALRGAGMRIRTLSPTALDLEPAYA